MALLTGIKALYADEPNCGGHEVSTFIKTPGEFKLVGSPSGGPLTLTLKVTGVAKVDAVYVSPLIFKNMPASQMNPSCTATRKEMDAFDIVCTIQSIEGQAGFVVDLWNSSGVCISGWVKTQFLEEAQTRCLGENRCSQFTYLPNGEVVRPPEEETPEDPTTPSEETDPAVVPTDINVCLLGNCAPPASTETAPPAEKAPATTENLGNTDPQPEAAPAVDPETGEPTGYVDGAPITGNSRGKGGGACSLTGNSENNMMGAAFLLMSIILLVNARRKRSCLDL